MPTVTLKNGQTVELPQGYYDELKMYADAYGDGVTVDDWYQTIVEMVANSITTEEFLKRISLTPQDDDEIH